MDIRTLLTETKPFLPKRKADSFDQDSVPSETSTIELSPSTISSSSRYTAPPTTMSKNVKFTLNDTSRSLNLTISPTDPPSAITSTVKDFFALHNCGVSFTDLKGCILIITPDNLLNGMEVIVNQIGLVEGDNTHRIKKRRKSMLSSRKKSVKKVIVENEIVEEEEEEEEEEGENDSGVEEHREKKERIFSSDVSIDNILNSSRRRLTKFSSQVLSQQNLLYLPIIESPIDFSYIHL
jgi:hypothetical protein